MLRKTTLTVALLAAALALSGCQSAKQRAQKHLASAMQLLEKGDVDRAIVEFRNVFQLDPKNREARMDFAALLEKRGDLGGAYNQYRQVVEQNPKDLEAIKAAARTAATLGNWTEADRQAKAGLELAPGDPELSGVKAASDYAAGVSAGNEANWTAAAAEVKKLLAGQPDNLLLHRVMIDSLMRQQNYDAAETEIDAALKLAPKDKSLYGMKLTVLAARKDDAGIEAELKKMIELFPDDPQMGATLVRWYVTHDKTAEAEAYLRQAAAKGGALSQAQLDLVSFLVRYRSPDAALTELDKIIAAAPANDQPAAGATTAQPPKGTAPGTGFTIRTFQALRASILFDRGQRDKAIEQMKTALKDAPESDETRRIRVALAKMEAQTGDMVGARALVEQVLAQDKGQIDAIKLKAGWLIQGDNPDDAITLLRDALGAHPNDAQIMTLMASAYQRTGNHQLMGDMLSQAVDASNKAPDESIRYAAFLVQDKKYLPAESVLVDALRLDPQNVAILAPLGQLYVLMKDWPRATQVADRLDELGTPQAKRAADGLRPAILAGQNNINAAVGYLQNLAQQGGGTARAADIAILRTYLAQGDMAKAQEFAKGLLAKSPDDPQTRFMAATVDAAAGDRAGAEATYRDLLKQDPKRQPVWVALIGLQNSSGDGKAARATLDQALAALPNSPDLLVLRAGFLEKDGNIDGAIRIYDDLYQKDSGNLILANNLASLLASYHGDDPASVERAYNIARRLQGTKVPAFADTYGWIMYLRGDFQGALPYLETAAKGLTRDPLTQFHLAEDYRQLNRPADAKAQYQKVLALVSPDDTRAFVATARKMAAGTPMPDASGSGTGTGGTGGSGTQSGG